MSITHNKATSDLTEKIKIHRHADPVSEKFLHLFIRSDPLSDTLRDITPPIMTDSSRRLFKSFLCRLQRSQALQGGNSIFLKLLNIPDLKPLTLHCCLQYQNTEASWDRKEKFVKTEAHSFTGSQRTMAQAIEIKERKICKSKWLDFTHFPANYYFFGLYCCETANI